jgi:SAM-dependent methyltransferase
MLTRSASVLGNVLAPRFTYRRLAARMAANWIRGIEPITDRLSRRNWAYFLRYSGAAMRCTVCGTASRAFFDFPNLARRKEHRIGELRETLQCNHCGATVRHRALASELLRVLSLRGAPRHASIADLARSGLGSMKVLDTDSFSPISSRLRHLPGYTRSSFVPDRPFGAELEPHRYNVDLQRMPFADGAFDVLLTSDVLEHVRDADAAHREIWRVLRPGGHYIFTVPFDPHCATHHVLVDTSGPEDVYLVPPQWHGDPLTGGVLAYRVYGRALERELSAMGFRCEFRLVNDEAALIQDGDVFVAEKVEQR